MESTEEPLLLSFSASSAATRASKLAMRSSKAFSLSAQSQPEPGVSELSPEPPPLPEDELPGGVEPSEDEEASVEADMSVELLPAIEPDADPAMEVSSEPGISPDSIVEPLPATEPDADPTSEADALPEAESDVEELPDSEADADALAD